MTKDKVFTLNNFLYLPDKEVKTPRGSYHYVPLRGYAFTLAVISEGEAIGWIGIDKLGKYANVRDWIQKTNWIDEGY